jgi:hypothetical protein
LQTFAPRSIVERMEWADAATTLQVGLNSWIIADGNYTDFRVGEVRSFALEYYDEYGLGRLPGGGDGRSCKPLGGCRYAVTGRTIHLSSGWAVIDVGVPAYRELYSLPPPPTRFQGVIWLGVDPFFYFESRAKESGAPPLIFDWRIHRIQVETAPRILQDDLWIYDPARLKLEDVGDTREGEDFVLHCQLLAAPPRHTLASA